MLLRLLPDVARCLGTKCSVMVKWDACKLQDTHAAEGPPFADCLSWGLHSLVRCFGTECFVIDVWGACELQETHAVEAPPRADCLS